jgi:hypothetical protein
MFHSKPSPSPAPVKPDTTDDLTRAWTRLARLELKADRLEGYRKVRIPKEKR